MPGGFDMLISLLGAGREALTVVAADAGNVPELVKKAVRERGSPTVEQFLSFLRLRVDPKCIDSLGMVLERGTNRRARDVLRIAGLAPPEFWAKGFATVNVILHARAKGLSQSQAAGTGKISPKTLARRCQRLFDSTWSDLLGVDAWEALVERLYRVGSDGQ